MTPSVSTEAVSGNTENEEYLDIALLNKNKDDLEPTEPPKLEEIKSSGKMNDNN